MTVGTRGPAVARVLFMSFVYVADCAKRIDSSDIERFTGLMSNTDWARHPILVDGLECLRETSEKLWGEYELAKTPVQIEALRLRTAVTLVGMPDKHARRFTDALIDYIRRATHVGSPALAVLNRAATAGRRQARLEVEDAFERALGARTHGAGDANAGATAAPPQAARPAAVAIEDATAAAPAPAAAPAQLPVAARPDAVSTRDDGAWTGGRIDVTCVRVVDETHDVRTFSFACVPARPFRYKPGQFATLQLVIEGKQVKRSYTLSSSPSRPDLLSVTVKRVPGGLVSNWLHDHLQPGATIGLSGPFGKFNCVDVSAPKLMLISGGSGVTPMMSMLRWFADTATPADIVFVNNVRTPSDIVFEHELHYLSTRLGDQLKLLIVPGRVSPARSWVGSTGHFNGPFLQACVPDLHERTAFLCGPPPYMDAVAATLQSLDFPTSQLHRESFGGPPPAASAKPAPAAAVATAPAAVVVPARAAVVAPAPAAAVVQAPPRVTVPASARATAVPAVVAVAGAAPAVGMSVKLQKSDRSFVCQPGENLLEAAERCGIDMENACRTGRCGTCKVKVVSGEMQMDDQEALSEADIESGYTLPCVGRPVGAVVLEA